MTTSSIVQEQLFAGFYMATYKKNTTAIIAECPCARTGSTLNERIVKGRVGKAVADGVQQAVVVW
jgi:hypothetical protein